MADSQNPYNTRWKKYFQGTYPSQHIMRELEEDIEKINSDRDYLKWLLGEFPELEDRIKAELVRMQGELDLREIYVWLYWWNNPEKWAVKGEVPGTKRNPPMPHPLEFEEVDTGVPGVKTKYPHPRNQPVPPQPTRYTPLQKPFTGAQTPGPAPAKPQGPQPGKPQENPMPPPEPDKVKGATTPTPPQGPTMPMVRPPLTGFGAIPGAAGGTTGAQAGVQRLKRMRDVLAAVTGQAAGLGVAAEPVNPLKDSGPNPGAGLMPGQGFGGSNRPLWLQSQWFPNPWRRQLVAPMPEGVNLVAALGGVFRVSDHVQGPKLPAPGPPRPPGFIGPIKGEAPLPAGLRGATTPSWKGNASTGGGGSTSTSDALAFLKRMREKANYLSIGGISGGTGRGTVPLSR